LKISIILQNKKFRKWLILLGILLLLFILAYPFICYFFAKSEIYRISKQFIISSPLVKTAVSEIKNVQLFYYGPVRAQYTTGYDFAHFWTNVTSSKGHFIISIYAERYNDKQWNVKILKIFSISRYKFYIFANIFFVLVFIVILFLQRKRFELN